MNENMVFQGKSVADLEHPEVPAGNASAQPPTMDPAKPPQSSPSTPVLEESSFFSFIPFSLIIKVVIGIVLLIVIGFIVTKVVLPLFSNKSNEKVTLVYWGLWEDPQVMKGVIEDFQRVNPTITVDYQKNDIKQYEQRLTTRIKEGKGPDVFRFHNSWLLPLSKVLLPLPKDVITPDEFKQWYYEAMQKDLIVNGAIYGIPLEVDTLALFINTEMFTAAGLQPPTTWEAFRDTARALTVKDQNGKIKTAGAALGTYDNITHASDIVSMLFLQNGVTVKDIAATAQNASDAFDFYSQFAKERDNVWDATLDESILAFAKGNLAMYFGYSWDVFAIRAMSPQMQFAVVPVPHLPDRAITMASYWIEGVSVKSTHQKEALLFMKYLTKKDVQQKLFAEEAKTRLFGEPYARVDLADSLKDNPLVYPFVQQAKSAGSTFFVSNTFDEGFNKQMNTYLADAVRAALGNTSSMTSVETLAKGVSAVLKQYGQ